MILLVNGNTSFISEHVDFKLIKIIKPIEKVNLTVFILIEKSFKDYFFICTRFKKLLHEPAPKCNGEIIKIGSD
jgi:hypothetical protein